MWAIKRADGSWLSNPNTMGELTIRVFETQTHAQRILDWMRRQWPSMVELVGAQSVPVEITELRAPKTEKEMK
jgi:hypothetical protein